MTCLLGLRLSGILSNSNCLPKPYRLTVGVGCVHTVGHAPVVAYPVIAGGLCMPPTGVTNLYKEIMNVCMCVSVRANRATC
jgi:hypothetical protein